MHPAVKEKHSLASTRLLQLRPEVLRTKDYVIAYKDGDSLNYSCPYDYIAIGSNAAIQLAMMGRQVVAVYLPPGGTISELIPAEMLICVNDLSAIDELEGRNYIVINDDTFNKSYSHVRLASSLDDCIEIRRLAGILNYKNVCKTLDLPKLHLMVQLWKPKQGRRLKELVNCLHKNLENPFIRTMHVFVEEGSGLVVSHLIKDLPLELRQKVLSYDMNGRLTYKDIMNHLSNIGESRDIVGFANADIFFDETIRELWNIDLRDRCIALLRHECSSAWASGDVGAEEPRLYGPRDDSQDAWFFNRDSLVSHKEAGESWSSLDFEVGRAGCHNCFAGELVRLRWLLGNPALSIKAYHLHESPERTYKETDLVSRGVYATIAPCGILESALLRQNAFPNRVAVKMMDTMAPIVEPWIGSDSAPYERGLKSIMGTLSDAAVRPNTDRTYHIIKTNNICITPEGLISSREGIGFGFDIDASELLWAQTTFSSISPTTSVNSAVFFPSIDMGGSFSHQLWNAARAATLWTLSGGTGEITISGPEVIPAMQPYLKFLGVKYVEGVLAVKGEARGLLPDAANQRLLEPIVKTLRHSFGETLLGDISVRPGHWTSIGCNEDLVEAINMKGASIDRYTIEPTSWIGKFMRQLREAEVVVIGHPVAVPNLWIMRPGSLVLDIAPTLAAARMATACGLRYMPFIFDNEGVDEMARILVKGAGGFKSSVAPTGPKIYVPSVRTDGFHKHLGDGFRELIELWSEAGFVERIFHDGVFCWFGSIGDTLLYDRRSDDWLQTDVPDAEKTFKKIVRVEDIINWARRPRLVEGVRTAGISLKKDKDLVFYGHIETARHFRVRSPKAIGVDWSSACTDFAMPVGSKYQYSQTEYLDRIKGAYYGLCLPGTGPRTNREAEYLALGVIPIFVGGSAQPTSGLKKGVHYLEASTPEEAATIVKQAHSSMMAAMDADAMSVACRDFYENNWSPEASWRLLQNHCTNCTD